MKTAKELIDVVYELSKGFIESDPTGQYEQLPTAFVSLKNGNHVVSMPWRDDIEKQVSIAALREHIAEHQAIAYCFVSEAWRSTYVEGEDTTVKPINRQNRQEVLTFTFQDRGHETGVASAEIVRHPNGTRTVGPLEVPVYGETRGLMVNLFANP